MIFQQNIPLAQYSNYKIGGPAKLFVEVKTKDELVDALARAKQLQERIFILGGGNNLLISDAGFSGAVIKISIAGSGLDEKHVLTIGAGALVSDLLRFTLLQSLSGWEWAGGLPGTIGGAIWGNAGAFGGETKDTVVEVTSLALETLETKVRNRAKCEFDYRTSIFKEQEQQGVKEVIIGAKFQLRPGLRAEIESTITDRVNYRIARQPLEYPNIGSIFKNIRIDKVSKQTLDEFRAMIKNDPFPVVPVAALSSAAGLKGFRIGDAMVSPKHPNFIVNMGQATAVDVKAVMAHVKEALREKFGVELEQEVIFVE